MSEKQKKSASSAKRRVESSKADNPDKKPHVVTHRKKKS